MNKGKDLKPAINIGPGYTIKKYLEARGWSQEDLAHITEITPKQISTIINNKARITIETARLLAKAFETSAEFWINLDTKYRLNMEADTQKENGAQIKAKIRKYMPVSEILKKEWFVFENSSEGYQSLYKEIWGVDYTDDSVYKKKTYCARQNREHEEYTRYYTSTWEKIARIKAESIRVPSYNKEGLKKIASVYTEYTYLKEGIDNFIKDLNKTGVKFLVLPHFSKTYLDGACFWDKKNPVIIYTGRYNRVDNFWFTVAHEIAHVLLHLPGMDKENVFLDDLNENDNTDNKEKEADKEAELILHVNEIIQAATPYTKYFTESRLKTISEKLRIEPSVILGVLQYKKLIDYRKLNKYKIKIINQLPEEIVFG